MTIYPDLATAARSLPIGDMASFYAVHCDPLYNAAEAARAWRFDIITNEANELIVRRQYRTNYIDLSDYRYFPALAHTPAEG